jgi:uncharacterized membrane-anchored protein YitT (DUF2179 family)
VINSSFSQQAVIMKSKLKVAINYLMILIGAALMGLSIVLFLSPNKIAAGGVSGIAVVINHLFNIPMD